MGDTDSPFWEKIFEALATVDAAVDLALQAAAPDASDKAISAITKKRLAQRSQQSLAQSKSIIQHLSSSLRDLQKTAREWQNSADYASKSQRELMEQAEAMSMDLRSTVDQVRRTEAARLTLSREAHDLKLKVAELEAEKQVMEAELLASRDQTTRAREELADTLRQMDQVQEEAARQLQEVERCRQDAAHAAGALDAARGEAERAATLAQRHQEVVAQLTADNLVLLMQLRKAEAELEGALQERQQLRLAVERQKGPWFAEVRAGVEAKVKEAMARAEELEQQLQDAHHQHQAELHQLAQEKAELESFLEASRSHEAYLSTQLQEATDKAAKAEQEMRAAAGAAEEQRGRAAELAAQVRALLDSARDMREECNERWAKEQAAEARAGQLAVDLEAALARLQQVGEEAARTRAALESQVAINRQLMARKEDMEWQLMSTMAQASGGEPLPLNVTVSGRMQVNPPHLPPSSQPPYLPPAPANPPSASHSHTNPSLPAASNPTQPPPPTSPAPPSSLPSSTPPQPPHSTASHHTPQAPAPYYSFRTDPAPRPPSSPTRPATAPGPVATPTAPGYPRPASAAHASPPLVPPTSSASASLPLSHSPRDAPPSGLPPTQPHLALPPRPASATAALPPRPPASSTNTTEARASPSSSPGGHPRPDVTTSGTQLHASSASTSDRAPTAVAASAAAAGQADEGGGAEEGLWPAAAAAHQVMGSMAQGQEGPSSRRRAIVDVFLAPQTAA